MHVRTVLVYPKTKILTPFVVCEAQSCATKWRLELGDLGELPSLPGDKVGDLGPQILVGFLVDDFPMVYQKFFVLRKEFFGSHAVTV